MCGARTLSSLTNNDGGETPSCLTCLEVMVLNVFFVLGEFFQDTRRGVGVIEDEKSKAPIRAATTRY